MPNNTPHGLGRLYKPDERDNLFLIRELLPTDIQITHKAWFSNAWWGDQGQTPECVAYATVHWIEDGPITHTGVAPIIQPEDAYFGAQAYDGFPLPHDGTTVRAMAKWLQEKGWISSYRWSFDLQTTIDTLLVFGPIILGINWYEQMFYPDENYYVRIGGKIAGGHCVVLDAVNTLAKRCRIKNSWGREWGNNGFAFISFDDLERLIYEQGEVLVAIENPI